MSAGLAVSDLARLVFSRANPHGVLAMLTAYFDDSGTHDSSPVVVIGGLLGTDAQWLGFENEWRARLAAPLEGKPPIKRFHMYDCEHGEGDFEGWNRAERDNVTYEFRQIIIRNKLFGYACALAHRDWDEVITGDLRLALGDAERYCVTSAVMRTLEHAKVLAPGDKVAFVLDNRPHREAANNRVFSIYQSLHRIGGPVPEPTTIAFESSTATLPLQGADMFAWEIYRYAQDWLIDGNSAKRRAHLQDLTKGIKAQVQIGDLAAITKMAAFISSQPNFKMVADYFDVP